MRVSSARAAFPWLLFAVVATSSSILATPAAAQEASGNDDSSQLDMVVVTGSRIARPDFESAAPIFTLDAEDFARYPVTSADQFLQTLPQFGTSFGASSSNSGNFGGANLNLHYLSANRTLVLIDGRRAPPSESGGSVDVSTIPTALIKSVEVVSGGASVVYGSDAIAGVVNFKLDDQFEGFKVTGLAGQTDYEDGEQYAFDLVFGKRFGGGRGGFVLYGGYSDRNAVLATDRPATAVDTRVTFVNGVPTFTAGVNNGLPNGAFIPAVTNLPSQAAVDTVFGRYGVAAGAVPRNSVLGFNNDNTLFTNSPVRNYRDGTVDSPYYGNFNADTYSLLPAERISAGVLGDWNLSDRVTAYARISYVNSEVTRQINPFTLTTNVPLTNPFIPADLRTILASRTTPGATFQISRNLVEVGPRTAAYDSDTFGAILGVRGKLPGAWSYDAYVMYNEIERDELAGGAFLTPRLTQLVTAADGGASLCSGGLDLFGLGAMSRQCVDYIGYTPTTLTTSEQTVVEATATGPLFKMWGGEALASFGASFRNDQFSTIGDPQVNAGLVTGGLRTSSSIDSSFDVSEVFGELYFPLVSDKRFVETLDLTVGYRYSDYSVSKDAQAYKAEFVYAPIRPIRFRGSYQRAVRAPGPSELYLPPTPSNEGITQDPCTFNSAYRNGSVAGVTPASVRALCLAQGVPAVVIDTFVGPTASTGTRRGNQALEPESADTYTAGVVFTPEFDSVYLQRISLSVDYWDIEVEEAISLLSLNDSVIRCFNFRAANPGYDPANAFCGNFARNANGQITNALVSPTNIGGLQVAGIDVQLDWTVPIESWNGSLNLKYAASYLDHSKRQAIVGDPLDDLTGSIGSASYSAFPDRKSTLSAVLRVGAFDVGARWRHISEMISQARALSPSLDSLGTPAMDYFDASAGWRISDRYELRFGVDNLTDEDPPIYSQAIQTNTDPTTFDVIGRRYYLRLSASF